MISAIKSVTAQKEDKPVENEVLEAEDYVEEEDDGHPYVSPTYQGFGAPPSSKENKDEESANFLFKQGFSLENIEMKTDLTDNGIKAITRGLMHFEIFQDPIVKKLAEKIMVLSISKDRKGRAELTTLTQTLANERGFGGGGSVMSRLLG